MGKNFYYFIAYNKFLQDPGGISSNVIGESRAHNQLSSNNLMNEQGNYIFVIYKTTMTGNG